ncbi:MAG TPA: hypothetical protein VFJ85_03935, partial [Acidimicrobiales bacterium]|nr:hypothetical protein [Acidimicrobiales bacterium]
MLLGTVASVLVATAVPAGALACDFTLGSTAPTATPGAVVPGGVFSWGKDNFGQLGDGAQVNQLAPIAAAEAGPGAGVVKVVGTSHILALMADGSVWGWGKNDLGELGRGNNSSGVVPALVSGLGPNTLNPVIDIAAGWNHSLALKADGTVWAWGSNSNGQLGNGSQIDTNAPVQVNGLGTPSLVSALGAGVGHSVALKSDGTVWTWGSNSSGQLGNNNTGVNSLTPVQVQKFATAGPPVTVTPLTGVTKIAVGLYHNLALTTSKNVFAWGSNATGRLGDNTTTDRPYAVNVLATAGSSPTNLLALDIAAGQQHSLAVKIANPSDTSGTAVSWGNNNALQLGLNETSGTPTGQKNLPSTVGGSSALTGVLQVSAGGGHSLARKAASVYSWGSNASGQLGLGNTTNTSVPSLVPGLDATVLTVVATDDSSFVIRLTPSVAGCAGGGQSKVVRQSFGVLKAVVRDAPTNAPAVGVTVTFTAPGSGASGTFAGGTNVKTAVTDANGVATSTEFTANAVAGAYTVVASAPGRLSGVPLRFVNQAGPPASITASKGSGQAVGLGASFPTALTAIVADADGNAVPDKSVTFTAPDSGASATFASGATATVTTDAKGQAIAPKLTANRTAGTYTVTAGVAGVGGTADFTLTNSAAIVPATTKTGGGYIIASADGGAFAFGDAVFLGSAGNMKLNKPIVGTAYTPDDSGYWLVATDGGIFSYGKAGFFGSTGNIKLNKPIVAMAPTPSGKGYWLVASDGGIFSYGDAGFFGSTGAMVLNKPIVGMAATPSGKGYWLVATDGGIFAFGDAVFQGSTGNLTLSKPIVSAAATPTGKGYWLVATDGGIFAFGDAKFWGSLGGSKLNSPIVGMASSPSGNGYWLVASDGGIFAFGDAKFRGSTGAIHLNQPIVGMAPTPTGDGYWLVARDGGIFSFGTAAFQGSTGNIRLNQPIVGISATRS